MTVCDPHLLSAYHDGELPPQTRARVEEHLRMCPSCADELRQLEVGSRILRDAQTETLSPRRMNELYESVRFAEHTDEQRVWRIGLTVSGLAASVLIIGLAWLAEMPGVGGAGRPAARPTPVVATRAPEAWERTAVTLVPDPISLNGVDDPRLDRSVQFANAEPFANWMVSRLSGGNPSGGTP